MAADPAKRTRAPLPDDLDWQDLKLFVAIARGGGLAPAARATGTSAPTLGRRMTALEEALGERLFERGRAGYALTAAGERLLDDAARMRATADEIERRRVGGTGRRRVRVSAGGWTMRHMVENLARYWTPEASWIPEFVQDWSRRDVGRREIDLGVRAGRPEEPWLAGRRIGTVEYAVYRARAMDGEDGPTLRVEPIAERPPGWPEDPGAAEGDAIGVSTASLGLPLVRQGLARMAMPCFVGDACEDLVRDGGPIASLGHERWLVVHQDHRHRSHVRAAIEAIAGFFAPDGTAR